MVGVSTCVNAVARHRPVSVVIWVASGGRGSVDRGRLSHDLDGSDWRGGRGGLRSLASILLGLFTHHFGPFVIVGHGLALVAFEASNAGYGLCTWLQLAAALITLSDTFEQTMYLERF